MIMYKGITLIYFYFCSNFDINCRYRGILRVSAPIIHESISPYGNAIKTTVVAMDLVCRPTTVVLNVCVVIFSRSFPLPLNTFYFVLVWSRNHEFCVPWCCYYSVSSVLLYTYRALLYTRSVWVTRVVRFIYSARLNYTCSRIVRILFHTR